MGPTQEELNEIDRVFGVTPPTVPDARLSGYFSSVNATTATAADNTNTGITPGRVGAPLPRTPTEVIPPNTYQRMPPRTGGLASSRAPTASRRRQPNPELTIEQIQSAFGTVVTTGTAAPIITGTSGPSSPTSEDEGLFAEMDRQLEEYNRQQEEAAKKEEEKINKDKEKEGLRLHNIEAIKRLTEENFPGNWDFTDSAFGYQITIYLGDIPIENSKSKKHLLRDVYVRMQFSKDLITIGKFFVDRGTLTYNEYIHNYLHSHCNNGATGTPFAGNTCLGSTNYETLMISMQHEAFSMYNYEVWLVQLRDFIGWESLEGGPHRPMHDMSNSSLHAEINWGSSADVCGALQLMFRDEAFEEVLHASIISSRGNLSVTVLLTDDMWKLMSKCVPQDLLVDYDDYTDTTIVPDVLSPVSQAALDDANATTNQLPFTFKGETKTRRVIQNVSDKETPEKIYEKRCSTNIANVLKSQLEKTIRGLVLTKSFQNADNS